MTEQRKWWLVRCEAGKLCNEFVEHGFVALGREMVQPDLSQTATRSELRSTLAKSMSWSSPNALGYAYGVLAKFVLDMSIGEPILTYNTPAKAYRVGRIVGPYEYAPNRIPGKQHFRAVQWEGDISLKQLSKKSKKSLSVQHSVVSVPDDTARELERLIGTSTWGTR